MTQVRFLLDENLPLRLKVAVQRFDPAIDVLRVGEAEAPTFGTLDPEILLYLKTSQRILVTDNRSSMPEHLEEYWASGGQIWGLLWTRPSSSLGELAEALFLIWSASEAEEWIDRLDWIPF